jgi:hypothetical protein
MYGNDYDWVCYGAPFPTSQLYDITRILKIADCLVFRRETTILYLHKDLGLASQPIGGL